MTEPIPSLDATDAVVTSVDETVRQARRLGLTWGLRPGVLSGDNFVTYDGEIAPTPVTSLIGSLQLDQRVMVMFVPPEGNYIIGILDVDWRFGEPITITVEESAGAIAVVFNHGYTIYVDNAGAGADNTRWWLDTPDNGEVVIGPRSGSAHLESLRLRTDATTGSAANCHIDATTQKISRSTSSRKYKVNITDSNIDLEKIRQARPVVFQDKNEFATNGSEARWHTGFIAEDIHDLGLSPLVHYTADGEPDSVQYDRFVPSLLQLINDLTKRVDDLERQLKRSEP